MPKRAAGLTARQVEMRKVAGLIADGDGLYLQVAGGAKSWVYRYQLDGIWGWGRCPCTPSPKPANWS
jgi:hypothetical protein